ncbi:MAG: hypothetical protein ACJ8BW_00900 [Ktedonobacteraceae bacterium]
MARQRDYHAEYLRRQELARERGYQSYHQERQHKETKEDRFSPVEWLRDVADKITEPITLKEEHYTNPRYEELGAGEWTHKDVSGEHGGVRWDEHREFGDYEEAKEFADWLMRNEDNISDAVNHGSKGAQLGKLDLYEDEYGDWYVDFDVMIEDATGDT